MNPRVLFVIPGEVLGASMICARRQSQSLAKEGIDVSEFHLRSRTSPWTLAREFFRFRAELRRFEPDLVHAQFGTMTALFSALVRGRKPLIVTYRGTDLNPSPGIRAALGRLLSQLAALRARRIVCVSAELRQRLWWRQSRVTVLPTGVDGGVFHPEDRSAARERLHWRENVRVVLFNAGFNRRIKRMDLAERALAVARDTLPDLRLELLSGEVDPERIPALMNASDCLLVTSDREGSPAVVQEALSCGLPIVSVPVGDVAERLEGVANVRVVERDAAALGQALVEMTEKPLRTDGPRKAAQFDAAGVARRLVGVYREAMGKWDML